MKINYDVFVGYELYFTTHTTALVSVSQVSVFRKKVLNKLL